MLNPPTINMLGIPVAAFARVDDLHTLFAETIDADQQKTIFNVNAHALNMACTAPDFHDALCAADQVICDSRGVQLAARLLGASVPVNFAYNVWIWDLARFCAACGYSIFLLGAAAGVADAAARKLCEHIPDLHIAGTHHGYFDRNRSSAENVAVLNVIRDAKPAILLVCFGMPLQEYWIMENRSDLAASVILTGGAALDYTSGRLRIAPAWMRARGLEWLGRLLAEPRRLGKRYLLGNPAFVFRLLMQRFFNRYPRC